MTYAEVLAYFGGTGYAIAKHCGLSIGAPHQWKMKGYVPIKAQMKIEELTKGELKADTHHVISQ